MEIDKVKYWTKDQIEIMMPMDKLPEFYGSYNDVVADLSSTEFPGDTVVVNDATSHFSFDSAHVADSSPFMNLSSAMSSTNIYDPMKERSPESFLSRPTSARWGAVGELPGANGYSTISQKKNSMAGMREMIFRVAAMQPVYIDPESVRPPKRRNVKISKDPQSVSARHRRERISERIRILQRLVPGGTKMDTASMLDEAIHYLKFLKTQVQSLEKAQANIPATESRFPLAMSGGSSLPLGKEHQEEPN